MTQSNYATGYSTAPGFRGIKAQNELHHRYLTEDVAYSLAFFTDLARHLSVQTPTMDAIIHLASVVAGQDYAPERARTMDNMGLSGLTREQVPAFWSCGTGPRSTGAPASPSAPGGLTGSSTAGPTEILRGAGNLRRIADLGQCYKQLNPSARDPVGCDLLSYRTSAERHELEAILGRYDTTIEEIVAGHEPPLATAEYAAEEAWKEAWDEIVLDLASGD